METITKTLKLDITKEKAFQKFVFELNEWWPKKYTWSQEKLVEIKIDGRKNGLCTEIGPNGFRCDWGRVTQIENENIEMKWQISPTRAPVPNPDNASNIKIEFSETAVSSTVLTFEHFNFENHGEGAKEYQEIMDGEQGWDYILNKYKEYCGI
ncbi:hypothetical protein [Bizionia paragorgiae]|uniref:hypothetical protein n=1 Tax=Bizionia paragorgiae TaxID=283786 RepID=UPI003A93CDF4